MLIEYIMNILKKYAYVYIITIITSYTIIFLENKFLPRIDVNNKQIRYLNVHQSDMVRFIGPIILFMYLGPIPNPVDTPPAVVLDDVT